MTPRASNTLIQPLDRVYRDAPTRICVAPGFDLGHRVLISVIGQQGVGQCKSARIKPEANWQSGYGGKSGTWHPMIPGKSTQPLLRTQRDGYRPRLFQRFLRTEKKLPTKPVLTRKMALSVRFCPDSSIEKRYANPSHEKTVSTTGTETGCWKSQQLAA